MQWDFPYKGSKYELTLQPGRYFLECWGAQGGGYNVNALNNLGVGGKGGYSSGTIFLQTTTNIFVYVGGTGKANANGFAQGGFNGGGSAWGSSNPNTDPAGGGGGSTDIRLNIDDLYSRVIVAGGGGGGGEDGETGGFGGGLEGGKSFWSTGSAGFPGTQTSSSNGATFGKGAHTAYDGGGGGGGWYGGGVNGGQSTPASSGSTNDNDGGSGGSGYVYTSQTASNYPSGCKLNPSYYLENAQTIGGDQTITEPNGQSSTGHSGDGYARIKMLGIPFENVFYSYHNDTTLDVMSKDEVCNESINIPSKVDNKPVVSILPRAFYRNTCLRSIKIPKTVELIGREAFSESTNLREVVFERDSFCASIGDSSFSDTSLAKITIPSRVRHLGEYCFKSTPLSFILFEIPSHLESIPSNCFHSSSLSSIFIPQSVKTFDNHAFSNSNIESINFNSTSQLEFIGENCFSNSQLISFDIPNSVKNISMKAFESTSALESVSFESGCRVDFIPEMCFLYSSINTISISKYVVSIGKLAFYNSGIQKVQFDAGSVCQNISEMSFYNTSLSSISLPPSVIIIGNFAFANCTKLEFVSYCSSTFQQNENIFASSVLLKNVSVAYYYSYSTFCGLPVLNIGICKFGNDANIKCGTPNKCPFCLYKTRESAYIFFCILLD